MGKKAFMNLEMQRKCDICGPIKERKAVVQLIFQTTDTTLVETRLCEEHFMEMYKDFSESVNEYFECKKRALEKEKNEYNEKILKEEKRLEDLKKQVMKTDNAELDEK